MNLIKINLVLLLTSLTFFVSAQTELLSEVPKTKKEFIESEPNVLATIKWLETTSMDIEEEKRAEQYALLLVWLTNSPTVTVEVNANVLTFIKKNSNLIMFFMAGWTRYSLENDYSKDIYEGSLAGVNFAINAYEKGGFKRDKKMEKLIKLRKAGKLEGWIKEQLAK